MAKATVHIWGTVSEEPSSHLELMLMNWNVQVIQRETIHVSDHNQFQQISNKWSLNYGPVDLRGHCTATFSLSCIKKKPK